MTIINYTATNGLYVSVKPTQLSRDTISRLQAFGDHSEPPEELHCTIAYSKTSVPVGSAEAAVMAAPTRFSASAIGCEAWPGSDGDGYIVLHLSSASLHSENRTWKALGATSDFDTYKPHVTIAKNLDIEKYKYQVQHIDKQLKSNPLPLTFFQLLISDLKK